MAKNTHSTCKDPFKAYLKVVSRRQINALATHFFLQGEYGTFQDGTSSPRSDSQLTRPQNRRRFFSADFQRIPRRSIENVSVAKPLYLS